MVQKLDLTLDPLVSIIVTNYNYAQFLPEAIESALHQDYSGVEVIVVDDGSTDNSRDVIRCYGKRIIPVFKENGGQGSAINAGFYRSKGDIVIFLDADDRLRRDTVEKTVTAYRAEPEATKVMYRLEVIDAEGKRSGVLMPHPHLPIRSGAMQKHVLTFPFDMTWMATSGNAFPAWVLEQILPIPEKDYPVLADYYLSFIAPLFGPVVFLKSIGAYYRIHSRNNHENPRTIDLGQIRRNITYSSTTCEYILQFADRLNLEGRPATTNGLLSVSLISQRLVSLKLYPVDHPIPEDTVWRLFQLGVTAAWRRFDVTWLMRFIYTIWITALALAPPQLARRLAVQFLLPDRRRMLNPLLQIMYR